MKNFHKGVISARTKNHDYSILIPIDIRLQYIDPKGNVRFVAIDLGKDSVISTGLLKELINQAEDQGNAPIQQVICQSLI